VPTTPFRNRFDLDITLRDAALDANNRPTQRMIANAAIGMHVEDAYYSTRELREAVRWVHEGVPAGKLKLAAILANDGADDFQRCLYFCLAGRGVVGMLDDLEWLEDLLERRGRVAGEQKRLKASLMPLTNPYVADAPDGPLVTMDGGFEQGPSWWADPTLST
jgi:hypothetical protein